MSRLLVAAALLGSTLVAIEPAAAQKTQSAPTPAQQADCLKKAQAFEAATGHHGVTVRTNCLKAAANSNTVTRTSGGYERTGTTLPTKYLCSRPGASTTYACSAAEFKTQTDAAARAARMKR